MLSRMLLGKSSSLKYDINKKEHPHPQPIETNKQTSTSNLFGDVLLEIGHDVIVDAPLAEQVDRLDEGDGLVEEVEPLADD